MRKLLPSVLACCSILLMSACATVPPTPEVVARAPPPTIQYVPVSTPCVKEAQFPAYPRTEIKREAIEKARQALLVLQREPPASAEEQGQAADDLIYVIFVLNVDLENLSKYALVANALLKGCVETPKG